MREEIPLFNQIKNGNRKVLELSVSAKHRYVVCIAKRFQNNGLTLHELILKGNLGLLKAVENFEPERGYSFLSYAIWCIRQSIIHAFLEDIKTKPIPLNKIGLISKGNCLLLNVERYCKREPKAKEIESMIEFQRKIMQDVLQPASNQMSNNCLRLK